ncbi:MAG: hypothetical protein COS88_02780 [Chloroflexi bacterium CG07_land_8_20_14_0_80_51_10]|nr:MAG: hypothetical protein COS88_02780 [Chloroflexi bacterium CG07_land_8_20_14_0_80_51_10]
MAKPSVYIETTVVSYLTAKPSRDLIVAAHQQVTVEWWEKTLLRCEPFVSPVVTEEIARGDAYHLALATYHGMDFLVSWNFTHILAALIRATIQDINTSQGIRTPIVCTPEELMEV